MGDIRRGLRSVVLFFALNGFLFGAWASRIPTIRDTLDLSEKDLGLLLLAMGCGAVLAMGVVGRWCDRWGQYFIAKRAAWLMAAIIPFLALAPSPPVLAVVLFLYGAFGGALDLSMNGFGTELESARKSSIMSRLHGMWSVGAGLGAASGILASLLGAGPLPHFFAAAGLAILVLFLFDRSDWQHTGTDDTPPAKVFVLPTGRLALIGLLALVAFMAEGVIQDWGALFIVDRFDQTEAIGATGLVWFAVAMVSMRMSGDMILDRFGAYRAVIFAACTATFGGLLVVLAPVYWLVWIGFGVMGLGYSLLAPVAFVGAARQRQFSKGHAMAAVTMLGYGGMLIGPPLIGGVAELFSLRTGFALITIVSAASVVLAPLFRAQTPNRNV
jgi:MFS family permease